jgi:hypothetical protein
MQARCKPQLAHSPITSMSYLGKVETSLSKLY